MKKMILFYLIGLTSQLYSQNCTEIIRTKEGEQLMGTVLSENSNEVIIQSAFLGKIKIPQSEIKSKTCIDTNYLVTVVLKDKSKISGIFLELDSTGLYLKSKKLEGNKISLHSISTMSFTRRYEGVKSDISNPNSTRYFFAPSAIPLEKGEGYYQNAYLLVNSANFGITKNFSLGGGVAIPILFYVTPKLSFKVSKNIYTGVGVIYTTTFLPDLRFGAGIPYGLFTYGNNERNITIGSGYGIVGLDGETQTTSLPIVTINAMYRISRKIQLVTENWVIPIKVKEYEDLERYDEFGYPYWEEVYLGEVDKLYMAFAFGSRFVFSDKSSVDFAPVILTDGKNTLMLPYLDFIYKF